jgi:hypothetical protein
MSFLNETCPSASITFEPASPIGSMMTSVQIRHWAVSRRRLTPPTSPQRAISYAIRTSSADRMLLQPRRGKPYLPATRVRSQST